MGLAELFLGSKNPFAQFVAANQGRIRGAGMGLAQGPDFGQGLANAAYYANQGAVQDDAYALAQREEAEREEQLQKQIDYLRSSNPQLADLVAAGMSPDAAFQEILMGLRPKEPTAMQFRDMNGDIIGIDPYTGKSQVVYDGPNGVAAGNLGTTIHAGRDEDGNLVPLQVSPNGGLIPAPLPEGMTWDPSASAQERAYGQETGKTQAERDQAAPLQAANLERLDAQTNNVIDTIDKATGQVAWDSTGLIGQVMGNIAGTKAFDLRETAKTIKANLGFAELQAMRDASPTGGALGQVAVQELEALQSTLASLNPDQSDAQLLQNLKLVRDLLDRQKMYRRMAAEAKFGPAAPPAAGTSTGVTWSYEP